MLEALTTKGRVEIEGSKGKKTRERGGEGHARLRKRAKRLGKNLCGDGMCLCGVIVGFC